MNLVIINMPRLKADGNPPSANWKRDVTWPLIVKLRARAEAAEAEVNRLRLQLLCSGRSKESVGAD